MGQTFHNGREDTLTIAGKTFRSRLFLGTGKYRNSAEMLAAFEAAGVEIITVALRRIDFDDPASRSILQDVDWQKGFGHFTANDVKGSFDRLKSPETKSPPWR